MVILATKQGGIKPYHLFTDKISVNKFKKGLKRWMKTKKLTF